jgi:hypothetical protein
MINLIKKEPIQAAATQNQPTISLFLSKLNKVAQFG